MPTKKKRVPLILSLVATLSAGLKSEKETSNALHQAAIANADVKRKRRATRNTQHATQPTNSARLVSSHNSFD